MSNIFTVTVPGTTANLGPGFDCIGAALSIYNRFKFTHLDTSEATPWKITIEGKDAARVSTDETNLVYRSFLKLYQHIQQSPPPVAIDIVMEVPLARGLGSSATAIIGGLVGANQLAGNPLALSELRDLAIAMEGHPDNVVPALLGNCQLSVLDNEGNWQICQLPWHEDLVPIVAIPDFELSTEEARKVLPTELSRADAIFNIAHFGLLVQGLQTGRGDWLKVAMADKLHQPYRQKLIRNYQEVQTAALAAGAYGMVISGAGPTLLALTNAESSEAVVTAMTRVWQEKGVKPMVRVMTLDTQGASNCY